MADIACGATYLRARESTRRRLLQLGIVGLLGSGVLATASAAQAANTGITQVVIQKSAPAFGGCSIGNVGTFTVVQGYALDVIDPNNPLNTVITDIQLAKRDANGFVDLLFNFYIILPTNLANGNGKIVADIPNRAGKTIASPNRSAGGNDPASSTVNCSGTTGTGTFWWPQGYATVEAGWEQDVSSGSGDPTSAATLPTLNTNMVATGVNANGTPMTTMPVAVNFGNQTITGPNYEYIVEGAGVGMYNLGGGLAIPNYPAAPLGGPCSTSGGQNVLTHRQHLDDTPTVLSPNEWQFNIGADGNCDSISLTPAGGVTSPPYYTSCPVSATAPTGACFVSQDIYELSNISANPTVNGAGHAAIRDFYSWLKGNSGTASQSLNPFPPGYIKDIYSWTSSQPARTLNDFIHLGFNGDLNGKRVFDGMLNWIGAGAGISMNYRWSHTTETERNRQQHLWVESFFPFADVTTTDPFSNTTDGRYVRCTANNTCPLMNFELYSANEYWVKTASLLHTDPTGSYDLPDNPLSRRYYMSSLQHGGGTQNSKTSTGVCQNYNNPIDAEYTERALWVALDQYVTKGVAPPPSQVPTLAGGTLVSSLSLKFPSGYMQTVNGINGGRPFPVLYTGLETTRYRFDMGPNFYQTWVPTINPPVITPPFEDNPENGPIYPSYVPQVNADGNDVTGIMMPEIQVPLGTYAGWNYRSGSSNAPTPQNDGPDGCESTGSYFQFAATSAIANANGDPRTDITTRYPTYATYLNQVVKALDKLVQNRFLLCGPDISGPLSLTGGGGEMANLVQDWTSISGLPPTMGLQPPSVIPACMTAHDFNGDHKSDIAWRDTAGDLALWLMNGGQVLQSSSLGTAPTTWSMVGQRDFNGDGDADILWRDNSGNTSIWLMNGASVASAVGLGAVPTTWTVNGTGDLNGDGKGDILWRDSAGDLSVWFMNGATVSSTASLGNVPPTWTLVGDDNNGDIFWHDNAGNYVVWHVNGSQVTASVSLGNVPLATWSIVGFGDFNGDGSTDILWRDSSGNTAIWFLNGSLAVQSTAGLGNIPANWSVAQTGDYNGDGYSDILWIDTAGDVALWLMNGGTVTSNVGLGNVSSPSTGGGTTWSVQSANAE